MEFALRVPPAGTRLTVHRWLQVTRRANLHTFSKRNTCAEDKAGRAKIYKCGGGPPLTRKCSESFCGRSAGAVCLDGNCFCCDFGASGMSGKILSAEHSSKTIRGSNPDFQKFEDLSSFAIFLSSFALLWWLCGVFSASPPSGDQVDGLPLVASNHSIFDRHTPGQITSNNLAWHT